MTSGTYVPPMPDTRWLETHPNDPKSPLIRSRIGSVGKAYWYGPGDPSYVGQLAADAKAQDKLVVLVPYALPSRDQGGNIGDVQAYRDYSQRMATAIGDTPTVVVLEPDSVLLWPDDPAAVDIRVRSLQAALDAYSALPNTWVYLDGTDGRFQDPVAVADRLNSILDGHGAHGIAYNSSNYNTPEQIDSYAAQVQQHLNRSNMPYVLDSSRNGLGPDAAGNWCNPAGRGLGHEPTTDPPAGNAEAWLWVKTPGTSDGYCGAYPAVPSGQFDPQIARDLIDNAPST